MKFALLRSTALLLGVLGACTTDDRNVAKRSEDVGSEALKPAFTVKPSSTLLGSVARQAHFAFRDQSGTFAGGAREYGVRVTKTETRIRLRSGASLSLGPTSMVRDGSEITATPRSIDREVDGTLTLNRGVVRERLENRTSGLEQSWRFDREPEGEGPLQIRIPTFGSNVPRRADGGQQFGTGDSHKTIQYGDGTWVDARGARTTITAKWNSGAIELSVPAAVVRSSAYPATLDPTIGPAFQIGPNGVGSSNDASFPSAASNGSESLIAWAASTGLQGRRVLASDGGFVDAAPLAVGPQAFNGGTSLVGTATASDGSNFGVTGFASTITTCIVSATDGTTLSTTPINSASVSLAHGGFATAYGGGVYLIVWTASLPAPPHNFAVNAARVQGSSGLLLDTASIALPFAGSTTANLSAAFDGTNFLIVDNNGSTVSGVRMTSTGALVDSTPVTLLSTGTEAGVAYGSGAYLLAWSGGAAHLDPSTLAVLDTPALVTNAGPQVAFGAGEFLVSGAGSSVNNLVGVRVTSTVLDATPFAIASDNAQNPALPAATFDGVDFVEAWPDAEANIKSVRVKTTGSVTATALVSGEPDQQQTPSVAYTNGVYFAAWSDLLAASESWDIVGARIRSSDGAILDPTGILLASTASDELTPAVAASSGEFAVVWNESDKTGPILKGSKIRASDGGFSGANGVSLVSLAAGSDVLSMAVAGSTSGPYLLGWIGTPGNVVRLSASDLSLLDASPTLLPRLPTDHIHIASNGTDFSAVYAAALSTSIPAPPPTVVATRVSGSDGSLLDPAGVVLFNNGTNAATLPCVTYGPSDYAYDYLALVPPTPIIVECNSQRGFNGVANSYDGLNMVIAFRDHTGNFVMPPEGINCNGAVAMPGDTLPVLASNGAGQTLAVTTSGSKIEGVMLGTCADAGFCGVDSDAGVAETDGGADIIDASTVDASADAAADDGGPIAFDDASTPFDAGKPATDSGSAPSDAAAGNDAASAGNDAGTGGDGDTGGGGGCNIQRRSDDSRPVDWIAIGAIALVASRLRRRSHSQKSG